MIKAYQKTFSPLLVFLVICFTSQSNIAVVKAKTCVATSENRYLCTDDPVKARAHQWEDQPDNSMNFEDIDLGIEQEIEGSQQEKEAVSKVLSEMKEYFETEVLVKQEYDSVIGRW